MVSALEIMAALILAISLTSLIYHARAAARMQAARASIAKPGYARASPAKVTPH